MESIRIVAGDSAPVPRWATLFVFAIHSSNAKLNLPNVFTCWCIMNRELHRVLVHIFGLHRVLIECTHATVTRDWDNLMFDVQQHNYAYKLRNYTKYTIYYIYYSIYLIQRQRQHLRRRSHVFHTTTRHTCVVWIVGKLCRICVLFMCLILSPKCASERIKCVCVYLFFHL